MKPGDFISKLDVTVFGNPVRHGRPELRRESCRQDQLLARVKRNAKIEIPRIGWIPVVPLGGGDDFIECAGAFPIASGIDQRRQVPGDNGIVNLGIRLALSHMAKTSIAASTTLGTLKERGI